jgi:hypothetical protein
LRKKKILKKRLKELGIKTIPKYVFYKEAYVNINIPLSRRSHDAITYFFESLTIISISATLSFSIYYFLAFMEIGFITYMVSGISFVISFFVIYFYLRTSILKEVKEVSNVFKKARKPKEIIIWDEGREKINS